MTFLLCLVSYAVGVVMGALTVIGVYHFIDNYDMEEEEA